MNCKKQGLNFLAFMFLFGVLMLNIVLPAKATSISGMDAVTVTNGTENASTSTITGSHSNNNSTNSTSTTLTLTGDSANLGSAVGELSFDVSYTLTGPSKFAGTDGKASISATSGLTDSFTGSTSGGSSKKGTGSVVIENWKAGSSWSIVMAASAAKGGISGYSKSSVSLTISNIVFKEYAVESVTFMGAAQPYTVNYYADAESSTISSVTVPAGSTGVKIEAALTKGMSISADNYYYCALANVVRSEVVTTLFTVDGAAVFADGDIITPVLRQDWDKDGIAPFLVGGNKYWDWDDAIFAAKSLGTMVLNEDYTMTTGIYTIPSGVKFLIPYNNVLTEHFDASPNMVSVSTPTVYRTLTVTEGVIIQCNGSINVGGQVSAESSSYAGRPTGAYGRINMLGENSKIILASADKTNSTAGALYCYGFIIGSGEVVAQPGATVYETFEACGFRGGTTTSGAWINNAGLDKKYKSFLFSEYAVHNIETEFTIHAGTDWYAIASIAPSIGDTIQASAQLCGTSGGMFRLETGTILCRRYDPNTDRMTFTVKGNADLHGFILSMGGTSLDTSKFILGLNGGWDFVVESGTVTTNCHFKLMPGSSMTIGEQGKLLVNKNLYLYDATDYVDKGYVYYRQKDYVTAAFPYIEKYNCMPTQYIATTNKTYNHTADNFPRSIDADDHTKLVVNGVLEVGSTGGLYTTSNGGQSSEKVMTGTGTFINNNTTATTVVTDYLDELLWFYESWYSYGMEDSNITVTPVVGLIKGLSTSKSDYKSFESGTYHGSSDGYWYEYTISTVTDGGEPVVAGYVGNGSAITFNDSNVASSLNAVNGSYTFDTSDYIKVESNNGTLIDNGDGTYTLTDVTADTTVTMITKCNIAATNVKAGDSLDLFFYVPKARLNNLKTELGFTNYNATVIRKDPLTGNNVETTTDNYDSWEEYGTDYLRFKVTDIAAKEMNDIVSVTLYGISGDSRIPISNTCQESVALYAYRVLESLENQESLDDKDKMLRTTVVDMLEYGTACQTNFDYNSSNLANAELTAEQKLHSSANITPNNNHVEGTNFVRSSVSTKERLVYTFYFENIAESMLSSMSAVVTYTDHNGSKITLGVAGGDFTYNKDYNLYGVDVKGLAIADGCQLIECVVMNGDTEFGRGTGSVESYLAAGSLETAGTTANEKTVYQKLMNFIDSAYRYFHDGDAPPEYENQAESMNVNEETEEVIDEAV